jgi:hypothetical protein
MAIWYILQPFGKFCGHLVYLWLFGIFFPFWYVLPRKIWQPWLSPLLSKICILSRNVVHSDLRVFKERTSLHLEVLETVSKERANFKSFIYILDIDKNRVFSYLYNRFIDIVHRLKPRFLSHLFFRTDEIQCFPTFSHIFIHFHTFSHIFTHFHTFSHIFTHFHTFSHIFTHFRTFSHIFEHFHTFSNIFTHFRTFPHIFEHFHTFCCDYLNSIKFRDSIFFAHSI